MKVSTTTSNMTKKKNSFPTKLLKSKNFKTKNNKVKQSKGVVKTVLKKILEETNPPKSPGKVKKTKDNLSIIKKSLEKQIRSPRQPTTTECHTKHQTAGTGNSKAKIENQPRKKLTKSKKNKSAKNLKEKINQFQHKRRNYEEVKPLVTPRNQTEIWKANLKKVDVKNCCQLQLDKVSACVSDLMKVVEDKSQGKADLLDLEEPIFLQVECIKIPICQTQQLRFTLPHPLVTKMSDILLITADKKGSKIHPDRAVEHYTDLLDKHNINFVNKVMPLRMLRQEYSQYEMKRKLVDQFDMILADSNILRSLPRILGGFALFSRKMPVPVHLDRTDLKKHLQTAMSKTQMTLKAKGNISTVQVGHTKMTVEEVAANIMEVSRSLGQLYPGGWRNMRCLHIKTAKSPALALFMSLLTPNSVLTPVIEKPKVKAVEGELSTYPDHIVVVKPDGNIGLKKIKTEQPYKPDTEFDEELIEAAKKYLQATKTVRYDDDSEAEDDAGVEENFMKNYKAAKKANAVDSDEENEEEEGEEEEEDESDDEEPVPPPISTSKKRKVEPIKKQAAGNKKQKLNTNSQQEKKQNNNKPGATGKPQKRGTRGGKKHKMSKDQRKALIKRKKAGK